MREDHPHMCSCVSESVPKHPELEQTIIIFLLKPPKTKTQHQISDIHTTTFKTTIGLIFLLIYTLCCTISRLFS